MILVALMFPVTTLPELTLPETVKLPDASSFDFETPPTSRLNKSPVNVDVAFNAN